MKYLKEFNQLLYKIYYKCIRIKLNVRALTKILRDQTIRSNSSPLSLSKKKKKLSEVIVVMSIDICLKERKPRICLPPAPKYPDSDPTVSTTKTLLSSLSQSEFLKPALLDPEECRFQALSATFWWQFLWPVVSSPQNPGTCTRSPTPGASFLLDSPGYAP